MRKPAAWTNTAVDPVLELLDDTALALSIGVITHNREHRMGTAPSRSTITRAIRRLETHGLIQTARGSSTDHEITPAGRAHLRGKYEPADG